MEFIKNHWIRLTYLIVSVGVIFVSFVSISGVLICESLAPKSL